MDVKEIAEITLVPPIAVPPVDHSQQQPSPEPAKQAGGDSSVSAMRPVIKIDSDGLAILQLQETNSGDVVFQIPSEEAARQYRERNAQDGTGKDQIEQLAASATGAVAAAAAAAASVTVVQPPAQAVQPKGAEMPQAVKSVEAQSGAKQTGSGRVDARA